MHAKLIMHTLGIIAGGGELPHRLVEHCRSEKRPYVVARIRGMADGTLSTHPGGEVGIGEIGKLIDLFHAHGVKAVCMVGIVRRPNFQTLKVDGRGLRLLPKVIAAARQGDDALLRVVMGEFEREGFVIEGAEAANRNLTLPLGPLGKYGIGLHSEDVDKAIQIARIMGQNDIGQGAVVCRGLVLAVEAQEGTDGLLHRVQSLPVAVRGSRQDRVGVLAKWPKPIQDRRVDLPTIGVKTVKDAARAGLAGIVGEAGATLVLNPARVKRLADKLGVFVVGVAP